MNSKLKPMWNGYLFWMSPKMLSLSGFCLRLATSSPSGMQIFNFLISGLTIAIVAVFFVLLIVQVRKISGKLEYIEESRLEIGLAGRLDYMKDFQFDCLQYSMLYYPSMHLAKLMLGHLCLGFAYDYHYVQFGGVIAAHVMYMMIQISSSGYKIKRDKIIYPFVDFIYVLFYLSKYLSNLSFYRYWAYLQCWTSRIDSKTRNNRFFLSLYHDYHTYSPSCAGYCWTYSELMRVIESQVI